MIKNKVLSTIKPAIVVKNLNKNFKLPVEANNSLKTLIIHGFKKNQYNELKVLSNIDFEIKKGEFFGIVGRNGSGKSTLLKLLAGIYSPNKGSKIQINGRLTPFIELGVGFNMELTGKENVYLNGALLGFSRKEMTAKYDDIVKFAELEKFMDQKLKNYSSGMQVRLAFSIAIRADSDILLIDEVLAVGDTRFQKKCLSVFRSLKNAGKTIILVSHSTADIEKFCDKVLVIEKGKQLGVMDSREAIALYDELNIDEADRAVQASMQKKRSGSQGITIKQIVIQKGKDLVTVPEALEIDFILKRTIGVKSNLPFVIGIAFYDADEVNISGPNSEHQKFFFKSNELEKKVTYALPTTIFNQGEYRLTVGVFDENYEKTYDHIVDATSFNVLTKEIYHGKVILNGKWTG